MLAVLVADEGGLRRLEPFGQPFADGVAGDLGVVAFVPDDRQLVERALGVPPGVGDDGTALSPTRTPKHEDLCLKALRRIERVLTCCTAI